MNFIKNHDSEIVYFTFEGITTQMKPNDNNILEEKKNCIGLNFDHSKIDKSNYKKHINKQHKAYAILTGKKSNITVIDYDNEEKFNADDSIYKFMDKQNLIVKTNNGYHIYFKYDEEIKQTSNKELEIDVRNDGGIIFAPPTKYTLLDGTETGYSHLLGQIKEIEPEYKKYLLDTLYTKTEKPKKEKTNNFIEKKESTSNDPKKIEEIKNLLECLKIDRSNDYKDWTSIGMILKNENMDVSLFHEFSSKSPKYDKSECEKKWYSFQKSGLGLGTLHYYAEQDNEILYYDKVKKIFDTDLYTPLFTTSLIAEYFKKLYEHLFIYCNESLYFYNGVYWKTDDKNKTQLNLFVNEKFYFKLVKYCTFHINKITEDKDKSTDQKQELIEKIQKLQSKINGIREGKKRRAIIDDIILYITNNDVEFDTNPMLFAFENRIYSLETNQFIPSNPKDYISLTTGYNWESDTFHDEKIETLNNLIAQILPDKKIRDYYLEILSTGLCGLQVQHFFVATGAGGNGKSVLNDLMIESIGNYSYVIPSTFLLNPIKTDNNPQAFGMNKKRFIKSQEPDKKYKVCSSTIKELTGNEKINVRDNYGNSKNCGIKINMTLLLECNDPPSLDETGDGMSRRVRAIPFNSRFVSKEDYDPTDPNNFIKDISYTTPKFRNEYKQAFTSILMEHFKTFKTNDFNISESPPECKKTTSLYMESSDDFYSWFDGDYENEEEEKKREQEEKKKKGIKEEVKEEVKQIITVLSFKEIFEHYKSSNYYSDLTKEQRRAMTMKKFFELINKNNFIKKYIKRRDQYINGDKLSSDSIVGWRLKEN